jgi:N-acetylglucosamine-6-phosphate deacetylase
MTNALTLINARIPDADKLQQIHINERGIIERIISMDYPLSESVNHPIVDVNRDWISLGGVDLQINGGLGLAFPNLEDKHFPLLQKICDFLWEQGVDGFLPTIVTTSEEKVQKALSVIQDFMEVQESEKTSGAKILGVHLEGPFLNYEKRGAHPSQYLLHPSLETLQWLLGDYTKIVKIITLAPELDFTGEVISYLHSQEIIISIGHSIATDREARKAFKLGASMVTHAFNAMPPLHHRKPGLLGEAIINPKVYCGLIADGEHVSPTMMDILLRASHYDQGIFLVSDTLAPMGLPDGVYPWDNRQIEVKNGTARLASGTLAGTTLPLLIGVKNLVKWEICPVGIAIALGTEAPRKAMGLPGLSVGQPAHLLRWHWQEETGELNWQRFSCLTSPTRSS